MRVTIAADGFLHPDHMPALPYDVALIPHEDRDGLRIALATADALVTRRVDVSEALLEGTRSLKLIQQVGTGTDRIDLAAAARCGVAVANTPGAPSPAVVEHAFLLILAALRNLPAQLAAMRAGGWSGPDVWEGRELGGSTLGVLGYGVIGRSIADRALAFGARVIVTTRTRPAEPIAGVSFVGLDVLLRESDVLVLAPALTPETRGLISREAIAAMKPGAILVNIARGAVVDEAALLDALQTGHLGAAALDAFVEEPLPADSPFRFLPSVIATPHTAGSSRQSRQRIWDQISDNLQRLAQGEPLRNIVNGVTGKVPLQP
jgi:phosphoglycerate dehydrogenase-like enzyme